MNAMPTNLLEVSSITPQIQQAREKILNKTYDFWSSTLAPDPDKYVMLLVDMIRSVLETYQRCAAEDGFARWGIKNSIVDGKFCALFHSIIPGAKSIFIYRHIVDVMRSYKARKWLRHEADCREIATRWCGNVSYMLERPKNDVSDQSMVIRYEEMIASPDEYADKIEQFLEIACTDRSVFDRKVNTFVGSKQQGFFGNWKSFGKSAARPCSDVVIRRLMMCSNGRKPQFQIRSDG